MSESILRCCAIIAVLFTSSAYSNGQESSSAPGERTRRGYVLKRGEGEVLGSDIIKASPKSGTQGSVMILQVMKDGFSTGVHAHLEADELFYIVSGKGRATLSGVDVTIEAGDVIFVPAGEDHRLFVAEGERVEVLEFLDKPGLEEEFRAWHYRLSDEPEELTLDEINAISRQYGTVYRTLK